MLSPGSRLRALDASPAPVDDFQLLGDAIELLSRNGTPTDTLELRLEELAAARAELLEPELTELAQAA